ncbi:MAG: hypothetical protein HOF35_12880 [Bacteroidetes bacterium]|jgi:hypothetical protein|nr:hypothetical protein [Bacteroidota bacterium]MBT4384386.1 hypothetical protein [Candidatus Peregrinibacteria bacterium]MBT4632238.1 hypothetical protein [Candidatus Peregrinibacteria bacterium]MBT5516681.1 hypothetical protein [Candidatus Peregrinibacteria bacterium]MBT5824351.1 hypothetical protein [Candidatus Peregrinibacteria bacterium]
MKFLIGLFLILFLSPITMWQGESQDLAGQFEKATIVQGQTTATDPLTCPEGDGECVYIKSVEETFTEGELIICGDLEPERFIIEQVEDRCTSSENCEKCYRVEDKKWEFTKEDKAFSTFEINGETVYPNEKSFFIGEETVATENEAERITYTYLPLADDMLATQSGKTIISTKNYEQSLLELQVRDKGLKWAMRFFSLILMIFGFLALSSQFAAPILGAFRAIPFFGGFIDTSLKGIVYAIMALAAAIIWAILLVVVIVLNNIFLLIGTIILLAMFLKYGLPKLKAKKH